MFKVFFIIAWLAYGLIEGIAIRKKSNERRLNLHIISLILWGLIGVCVCYQFFIVK